MPVAVSVADQGLDRALRSCIAINRVFARRHNGASGACWRAASRRLSVPTAFDIEILEGTRRSEVMTRLRGTMNDCIGFHRRDQHLNTVPVTQVDLVVREASLLTLQPLLIPTGITGRAKEITAHVVVGSAHAPANSVKYATASEPISPDEPVMMTDSTV